MRELRIGDRLQNDAKIMEISYKRQPGGLFVTIALAKWERENLGKLRGYVTWLVDPQGYALLGHYFQNDIVKAAKDYVDRIK